jgi:hypothetical protein
MNENTITLTFANKEMANYIRLVCTRKGVMLEDYIVGNFEWDDQLNCMQYDFPRKITSDTCIDCDYRDKCPDAVV